MTTFDPYYKWLGIHPDEQPPDYYRLLGLQKFEKNSEVIANAVDLRLAHVARFEEGPHDAESKWLQGEINAASVCLLNAQSKEFYDRSIRRTASPPTEQPLPPVNQSQPQVAQTAPPKVVRNSRGGFQISRPIAIAAAGLAVVLSVGGLLWFIGKLAAPAPEVADATSSTRKLQKKKSPPKEKDQPQRNSIKGKRHDAVKQPDKDKGDLNQPETASQPRAIKQSTEAPQRKEDVTKKPDMDKQQERPQTKPSTNGSASEVIRGNAGRNSSSPTPVDLASLKAAARKVPQVFERAKILIENSDGIASLDKDFTVEAWIRIKTNRNGGRVLGVGVVDQQWSIVFSGPSPSRFALVYRGDSGKMQVAPKRPEFRNIGKPIHFAVVRAGELIRVFVNGERLLEHVVPRLPPARKAELLFGSTFPCFNKCDVLSMRVCSSARYSADFEPVEVLQSDRFTLALHHFVKPSEIVADSSGNNRSAKMVDVEWVGLSDTDQDPAPISLKRTLKVPARPIDIASLSSPARRVPRIVQRARIDVENSGGIASLDKDFTVEIWMKVETTLSGGKVFGVDEQWWLAMDRWSGSRVILEYQGANGKMEKSAKMPEFHNVGKPIHFAVVRVGQAMSVFVDGKRLIKQVVPRDKPDHKAGFQVGSPSCQNKCYVLSLRISDSARYSADFKPTEVLKSDPSTLTLHHFAKPGDVLDASGNNRHVVVVDTMWVKLGDAFKNADRSRDDRPTQPVPTR